MGKENPPGDPRWTSCFMWVAAGLVLAGMLIIAVAWT